MGNQKKITIFIAGFLIIGTLITLFFPKEEQYNENVEIRIGAGDDISGILMQETAEFLGEKYKISESMETSSFQDC